MLTPAHEPTTRAATRSAVEPAEETLAANQSRPGSFCADPVESTHGAGDGRPEISQPVQVLHSGENMPLPQATTVTACLQGATLKTSGQRQRDRRGQQTSVEINLDHDAVLLGANPAWVPPAVALVSAVDPCGLCILSLNGILHNSQSAKR